MAVGALAESRLRTRLATALAAVASHVALDTTIFWHARDAQNAPVPHFEWPEGTFAPLEVLPYPHDFQSWVLGMALVASAFTVFVVLRRYWWGMIWGISPDLIDWGLLRPLAGISPIHDLIKKVSTPWGFGVELLLTAAVVAAVYWWDRNKRAAAAGGSPPAG